MLFVEAKGTHHQLEGIEVFQSIGATSLRGRLTMMGNEKKQPRNPCEFQATMRWPQGASEITVKKQTRLELVLPKCALQLFHSQSQFFGAARNACENLESFARRWARHFIAYWRATNLFEKIASSRNRRLKLRSRQTQKFVGGSPTHICPVCHACRSDSQLSTTVSISNCVKELLARNRWASATYIQEPVQGCIIGTVGQIAQTGSTGSGRQRLCALAAEIHSDERGFRVVKTRANSTNLRAISRVAPCKFDICQLNCSSDNSASSSGLAGQINVKVNHLFPFSPV